MVIVRGDHRVNEIKLANALGQQFRPMRAEEVETRIGPPGFIGPVGASVPILLDDGVAPGSYVTGANQPDAHLRGVEPGRDFQFERADVRGVVAGDTVDGKQIRIEPAIEIGNIFKLGTRYSEPLGATYLDESGAEQLIWMGSYGFGPARAAAAAIEQSADEHGISWPRGVAPFDVELVVLGREGSEERALGDRLYDELREQGLDTLYDDRDANPGEKFAVAELLGCPLRVTVGRRTLESGEVEVQIRRGLEARAVPLDGAAEAVAAAVARTSLTKRRLFGVDRSGPAPNATRSDQPWHPWTIPNAIGYLRLAGIPAFLAVALSSRNGHDALAAVLFAVIGWADYLDGFTARLTGQYSRLGALLDPLIDRLLVISGMVVVWNFELLPRWAIAVAVGREVLMLVLSRLALRRGIELKINWPGRLAVAPVMGAPFFAIAGVHWLALVMLYVGLALAWLATVLYVQRGLQEPSSST